MTGLNTPLFEGKLIRLTAREAERDAEIESQWTHDPEYLRMTNLRPAIPLSIPLLKKRYEEEDKGKQNVILAIRTLGEDRLVGFVALRWIEWTNGSAQLSLSIGRPEDHGKGYGTEALRLILRYAFDELNLYRLGATTFEYNPRATAFLERAGFQTEVRRRQAIHREGQRWDVLLFGLLREEWQR